MLRMRAYLMSIHEVQAESSLFAPAEKPLSGEREALLKSLGYLN